MVIELLVAYHVHLNISQVRQHLRYLKRNSPVSIQPRLIRIRGKFPVSVNPHETFAKMHSLGELTLWLIPGGKISQGKAEVCGEVAGATVVSNTPVSRAINRRVIMHEVGHLLGASHLHNTRTVMDWMPNSDDIKNNVQLKFHKFSVDEIAACQYKRKHDEK